MTVDHEQLFILSNYFHVDPFQGFAVFNMGEMK